jgi:hypothetical protein
MVSLGPKTRCPLGSPTILYYGTDDCLRIPVLQVAGFHVARCASLTELETWLTETPEIAAVLFEESRARNADAAAELARKCSTAALVLFRHPSGDSSEAKFDRVIAPATPPLHWLRKVAEILLARVASAQAAPGWAQVARDLQARRQDLPPDEDSGVRSRARRIQPEKRRCT